MKLQEFQVSLQPSIFPCATSPAVRTSRIVPLELWAANSWTVSGTTELPAAVDEVSVAAWLPPELEGDWQAVKVRNKSRAEKRVNFMD